MSGCFVYIYVLVLCTVSGGACRGKAGVSNPLDLELETVVGHHVNPVLLTAEPFLQPPTDLPSGIQGTDNEVPLSFTAFSILFR